MNLNSVVEIHALDVLMRNECGNRVYCRMMLLRLSERHVVIEPVLDYLSNDEPVSGLSVSSILMTDLQGVKELLVGRHMANGYDSSGWTWEQLDTGVGEVDIAAYPISGLPSAFGKIWADIYQVNGNVCYERRR